MSETFDKLKALLAKQNTLSDADIEQMVSEHGEMTDEERVTLEAEKLEAEKKAKGEGVTMDQYLEALKVLDNAEEGSDEYNKAEAIVEQYESGG